MMIVEEFEEVFDGDRERRSENDGSRRMRC